MLDLITVMGTAVWLGILTSISPCPMATNITAISYVSRKIGKPSQVFLTGLLYSLGRTLAYTVLGILLVTSFLSAPILSFMLQKYMNLVMGPLLIIVGIILLDIIPISFSGRGLSTKMQTRIDTMGIWGAVPLGIFFALSFCPVSAALFFGSLLSLALTHNSGVLLPASYGLATGLPVLLFSILLSLGVSHVAKVYNKIQSYEKWARRITAVLFILVGLYYSLTQIFGFSFYTSSI